MPNSYKNKNIVLQINKLYSFNTIEFPDELLRKMWLEIDFGEAKEKLFYWQQMLTKAIFLKDEEKQKMWIDKILYSFEAKALAVRKVSEISKSAPRNR